MVEKIYQVYRPTEEKHKYFFLKLGLGAFMRTEFVCFSVLRVASGPRVKLASCKSALSPRWLTLLAVLRRLVLLFVALWFILRGDLFYVLACLFCSCVFQSFQHCDYLAWGRESLMLVLFVRLFDALVWFCLFPLPLGVWEGLWLWHSLDFSLTFVLGQTRTLAILDRCTGWSGSLLVTQVLLQILSCVGSNYYYENGPLHGRKAIFRDYEDKVWSGFSLSHYRIIRSVKYVSI